MDIEKERIEALFKEHLLQEAIPEKEDYDRFKKDFWEIIKKNQSAELWEYILHLFYKHRKEYKDRLKMIIRVFLMADEKMPRRRIFMEMAKINSVLFLPEIMSERTEKFQNEAYFYAQSDEPVLILGETGTGKEGVAKTLHDISPRGDKVFKAINCAGIPETLLESELFGIIKGAATGVKETRPGLFEVVGDGTLFLDEIGDMSLSMQAKILRVLEDGEFYRVGDYKEPIKFRGRIISATNKNLEEDTKKSKFRLDLYHRINTFEIRLEPLREYSKKEREFILNRIIQDIELKKKKNIKGFSGDALSLLSDYDFPGNFRELKNVLLHALTVSNGEIITKKDFPNRILKSRIASSNKLDNYFASMSHPELLDKFNELEKDNLLSLLRECNGNISKAYELSKYQKSYTTFFRRLSELGISKGNIKKQNI